MEPNSLGERGPLSEVFSQLDTLLSGMIGGKYYKQFASYLKENHFHSSRLNYALV